MPGTISFAWTARVELGWEEPPIVTIGLEFRNHAISVFFDLTLLADHQSVKVRGILFDDPVGTRPKSSASWPGRSRQPGCRQPPWSRSAPGPPVRTDVGERSREGGPTTVGCLAAAQARGALRRGSPSRSRGVAP